MADQEKELERRMERIQKEREEKEKKEAQAKAAAEEERRKSEEHDGQTKHGDHWYKDGDKESWEDTFIDESEDVEAKLDNIWDWITYIFALIVDACTVVFKLAMGFTDGGKSFDEGFALLDKDYHQTEWLSGETLEMIGNERDTYMV